MADCIIKIDGADIIIEGIKFTEFKRDRDENTGRPSGPVKSPRIILTRNPLFNPKVIVDWYAKKTGKNVTIELNEEINEKSTSVTIELNDAYIIDFNVEYDVTGARHITEISTITARVVKVEGVNFEWSWPNL